MNQGILSEISLITSLIFSLSALALSVLTFRIQRTESSYSEVDKAYFDILKLAIQYPSLRDIAQTQTYYERPEGDPYRIQYESYAFIAWTLWRPFSTDRETNLRGLASHPRGYPSSWRRTGCIIIGFVAIYVCSKPHSRSLLWQSSTTFPCMKEPQAI